MAGDALGARPQLAAGGIGPRSASVGAARGICCDNRSTAHLGLAEPWVKSSTLAGGPADTVSSHLTPTVAMIDS